MLSSLLSDFKRAVGEMLTMAGCALIVVAAAVIAFGCFALAAFVWLENTYDTITAALTLGIFFVIVAVIVLIVILIMRSRARKRVQKSRQRWWTDPAVVATGVELVRMLGARRVIPAALIAGVILGVMQAGSRKK